MMLREFNRDLIGFSRLVTRSENQLILQALMDYEGEVTVWSSINATSNVTICQRGVTFGKVVLALFVRQ